MRIACLTAIAVAVFGCGGADEEQGGAGGEAGGGRDAGVLVDGATIGLDAGAGGPDILRECEDGDERPCGSDEGACQMGVQVCRQGLFGAACEGEVAPIDELCNELDDDCDGRADEGYNLGRSCKALNDRNVEVDGLTACDLETGMVVCIEIEGCEVDNDSDGVTACTDCDDDDPDNTPGARELCDGRDNDCDGSVDEIYADLESLCYVGDGECRRAGTVVCAADGLGTVCDAEVGAADPIEICGDDADNDCDGLVDEGFPLGDACRVGNGVCEVDGVLVCDQARTGVICQGDVPAPPSPERCGTGLDEDCDGAVDEGFDDGNACVAGVGACLQRGRMVCNEAGNGTECDAVPTAPGLELCGDATDNDCDGETDELAELGEPCTAGVGECRREGEMVCGANGQAVCGAVPGDPADELCDGRDQDCDGRNDEGFDLGAVCFEGVGECRAEGRRVCHADAQRAECSAQPRAPRDERCDDLDNDCDGRMDEGFGLGGPCNEGFGLCVADGRVICGPDGEAACDAVPAEPQEETCDRIDNDCDGGVDEVGLYLYDDPLNCGMCGNVCPGEDAICQDANCYRVYYVSPDGSNVLGDGGPESPWRSITHAVTNAEGPLVIIRVRPGTYGPDNDLLPTENEAWPVPLRDGLQIVGLGEGFDRASEVELRGEGDQPFFTLDNLGLLPVRLEALAFVDGGSVVRMVQSEASLYDLLVQDKSAVSASFVDLREDSSVLIERSRVLRSGSRSSCAIWSNASAVTIIRSTFVENRRNDADTVLCLFGNSEGEVVNSAFVGNQGYAITAWVNRAPLRIVHSSFGENSQAAVRLVGSQAFIANSLFAWNGNYGIQTDEVVTPDDVELRGSLFHGHTNTAWFRGNRGNIDINGPGGSEDNIGGDPLVFSRIQFNLRLREGSPAIDAADPAVTAEWAIEFDNDGSIRDGAPDIGAFEFRR